MLKVIFSIVVAMAVMVGIVALLGSRLPVGHVASRAAVINAPPDVVFQTMTEFRSAPAWRPGVTRITVSTDSLTGRQRVVEESKNGIMTMEVEQLVPPTRFVTRIVDEDLPYGGAWAHALEAQGNATRVIITEHGEVYNPIFRFVAKYLMGHSGTIDAYLSDLGRKFNTPVSIVDAEPIPAK
ncbi:MAG TPA: SRPBCC family protein [Gemmatimonadaceae bacterium]